MRDKQDFLVHRGIALARRVLRSLDEVGIFAQSSVSLEHQHLAGWYVVRGIDCRQVEDCLSRGAHPVFLGVAWRRPVMFNLWHAYGSQWKLLQMRELRQHQRALQIGQ